MIKIIKLISILYLTFTIVSCSTLSVTKGRILKLPINFPYSKFDSLEKAKEYKVVVDDEIQLQMMSNDGFNFISIGSVAGSGSVTGYKVRPDSTVKIPIIGRIKVVGLTLDEIETLFENILAKTYQSPFVIAGIGNKRIYVFSGISSASIFTLKNQNTTLFEVIAQSGGVPGTVNVSRIKIIRGDLKNPTIYLVDLSTLEGMKDANLFMQAGDILYFEPFLNYPSIILGDVAGIVGTLTSLVLIITLVK